MNVAHLKRDADEFCGIYGVGESSLVGVVHIQAVDFKALVLQKTRADSRVHAAGKSEHDLFHLLPSIQTISTEISAGDTPEMRLA